MGVDDFCNFAELSLFVGQSNTFQGHPTTVFRKISVRRSKYIASNFLLLEDGLKFLDVTVPFMYNSRGISYTFPTIFCELNFHILFPEIGYFL